MERGSYSFRDGHRWTPLPRHQQPNRSLWNDKILALALSWGGSWSFSRACRFRVDLVSTWNVYRSYGNLHVDFCVACKKTPWRDSPQLTSWIIRLSSVTMMQMQTWYSSWKSILRFRKLSSRRTWHSRKTWWCSWKMWSASLSESHIKASDHIIDST